jgi:hypothetical protein
MALALDGRRIGELGLSSTDNNGEVQAEVGLHSTARLGGLQGRRRSADGFRQRNVELEHGRRGKGEEKSCAARSVAELEEEDGRGLDSAATRVGLEEAAPHGAGEGPGRARPRAEQGVAVRHDTDSAGFVWTALIARAGPMGKEVWVQPTRKQCHFPFIRKIFRLT